MNTNIIYFSPTKTTAKIVKQIASAIDKNYQEYDLTLKQKRDEYRKNKFNSDDLVIVGVPVYSGRIPQIIEEYLLDFKGNNTLAIFVVVYGNRAYEDSLLELKTIFETKGFIGIAAGAFIGEHSFTNKVATGRPNLEDLNTAFKFGEDIKSKIENDSNLKNTKLFVKGNFPYKERKQSPIMIPQTDDKCTDCGICAKICPMEAISFTNFRDIDPTKCIHCCRCVQECPENAKRINHEMFDKITNTLIANCSAIEREIELF